MADDDDEGELDFDSTLFTEEGYFEEFVGSEDEEEGEVGGKRKIMSVELALQRESAYVHKVATLVLHQSSQASQLKLKHGVATTMPSDYLSSLPHPSYTKPILQIHPLETSFCLPPPLHHSYANQNQPFQEPSCLPPTHLQQSYSNNPTKLQPSKNISDSPPPQLQQYYLDKFLQNQHSPNLSCLPPEQLHNLLQTQSSQNPSSMPPGSYPMQTPQAQAPDELTSLQLMQSEQSYAFRQQSPKNPSSRLPTLLQQPCATETIQNESSENLSHIAAPQLQLFCARQTIQTPSSVNLSPLQMQQPYHNQTQSSGSLSFSPPSQLRQSHNMSTSQIQPCSTVSELRRHHEMKKHHARPDENSVQSIKIPRIEIEPFWCDICKVRSMNEECYLQHLNGKKHVAEAQAIKAAMEARGGSHLLNLDQN